MENSSKYFENRACSYYPCHKGTDELNCLFCYCPLYNIENCPGSPKWMEKNGGRLKVCTDCVFPHRAENYDKIMAILKLAAAGKV
ncbi:MAG: cysteine-rich small domain-containing protein [Eubacteriales bacterium]|nr:cysteine-rich small domain-containing protein [Eubacteriales bacterium]